MNPHNRERKGIAETALNTARAGYLERRLFDVAQDAISGEDDCGSKEGVTISRVSASGIEISFAKNIRGRLLATPVLDGKGKTLFGKGTMLSDEDAQVIEESNIDSVSVHSPMVCKSLYGICRKCYGIDLTTNELIDIGEAVGTIAAQAIGEPGTQLTMRTFHSGGTATVGGDITQGLPRVEEVFEKRAPKSAAAIAKVSGTVSEIKDDGKEKLIILLPDEKLAKTSKKKIEYPVHFRRMVLVKVGDKVKKGDFLTDGSAHIDELHIFGSKEKAQNYIISEISKIYELQGASISRKHIEVIIRQMFSRQKVKDPGDTGFTTGEVVEEREIIKANTEAQKNKKTPATVESLILGITEVSLSRKSFLSAASFQNTPRILINAAIRGCEDKLIGLKENVIIGRLIPAGSGFSGSPKAIMVEKVAQERENK